jgi:hypothetical protein
MYVWGDSRIGTPARSIEKNKTELGAVGMKVSDLRSIGFFEKPLEML